MIIQYECEGCHSSNDYRDNVATCKICDGDFCVKCARSGEVSGEICDMCNHAIEEMRERLENVGSNTARALFAELYGEDEDFDL
jgi:hypothetical protein